LRESTPGIDLREDPDADLSPVVAHMRGGGVIAYPTETVYGLGGACTPDAVSAVRALKRREGTKPLIALIEDEAMVQALRWNAAAKELAAIFWPGSVTLVLPDPDEFFPEGVRNGQTGTVGVRVSPHPVAARLVRALGGPLTSTSLNLPGEAPVTSGEEAREILARLGAGDVWLLDAGTLPPSAPSTVVDCSTDLPVVLREGAVPTSRLRCAIPEIHDRHAD